MSLTLLACSDVVEEADAPHRTLAQGVDAQLLELNESTPGFGGLFYDEQGALNVYMTQGQLDALSQETLRATFAEYLARPARGALGVQSQRDLNVLKGDYAFRDLLTWRAQLNSLGVEGVVLTDVDERLNRVRVGVKDARAEAEFKARLAEQNIPFGAVVTEEVEPIKVTKSLRSKVRPLVSGVEVGFGDLVCTLGFNAIRDGQKGFVTNSHCTDEAGGTEGTRYTQGGERVGKEVADPKYRESEDCPSGRRCRLSDSAFVAAEDVKRDTDGLAKTDSKKGGRGSDVTITGQLDIAGYEKKTVVGEELDKIGSSTGWTFGEVEETCVSVDVYDEDGDTGLTLLCQDVVFADAYDGDSGAPVFRYAGGGGKVYLRGILWGSGGGTFVFSPVGQIRKELDLD